MEGIDAPHLKPFPWLQMVTLNVGMLAHTFLFTVPLPYVGFMVVDFGVAESKDKAGYWTGWIASGFMIGQ